MSVYHLKLYAMNLKYTLLILMLALVLGNCGSSNSEVMENPPVDKVQVIAPSTKLGTASDNVANMQLKPGKLVGLNQINEANCLRAVKAGMCLDIIVSDAIAFDKDMTMSGLEQVILTSADAVQKTGAELWGMHLPYVMYDIASTDEAMRMTAVSNLKEIMEMSLKHLKLQHFVIHPSTGAALTTDRNFNERKSQSQKSIRELYKYLTTINSTYNRQAILCVENCQRSVAYDAESLLDLLSAEGLENVRVCLDTGHALIPLNGKYMNPTKNGDAIGLLKKIGTRLGTLHIQQNAGAVGETGTQDTHLEPFDGGLIDWGNFYYELLKNNQYRGCFLYEVSYVKDYNGATSTIESAKSNYSSTIYPAYERWLQAMKSKLNNINN